ncbi:DUF4030 domain-containing protein [Bacillus sp. KH172YL63]|uniref:DUF4030 domain-containing protein n=1 Tax=Bacillus sp. KH172YL63 TaxID=2709784 RepID=UPI0013E51BFA|nr:DUF4030 domain-containing protein [Bacillus sp. KH172YL63]BCB04228.1 hypothetical protein KH172YL63_23610 [Bacillus sp. KH172YL63]
MNDLSNRLKQKIDEVSIPEHKLNHAIEQAIEKGMRHKKKQRRKWIYASSTAVLLVGLFLGSGAVSPAMGTVVSKIPFFGEILFKDEGVSASISERLIEEGINQDHFNISITQEKEIQIGIKGHVNNFELIEEKIGTIVSDVLQSNGYDAYTWKVVRARAEKTPVKSEEVQKRSENDSLIDSETRKAAAKLNIDVQAIYFRGKPKSILIEIPDTESRTKELREIVTNIMTTHHLEEKPVKIKKVNVSKQIQETRWGQVLTGLHQDLIGKKEYKVQTVGYTVYPQPKIMVTLSISSRDVGAKKFAEQLEDRIRDYLKSEKVSLLIQDDSYTIEINSKEGKLIN